MGASIYNTQDGLDLTGNAFTNPVTMDCKGSALDFARQVQRSKSISWRC